MQRPGPGDSHRPASRDAWSSRSLGRPTGYGRIAPHDRLREIQRRDRRADLTRRTFLTGLSTLGIAASAGVQLDGATVEIARHRDLGWIDTVDTAASAPPRRFAGRGAWLLFPGTNVHTSKHIATALAPSIGAFGPLVAMKYPDQFDVRSVIENVHNFARRHRMRQLNFYGQSLGGMVALTVGAALNKLGIRVGMLIADCAPTSFHDVRYVGGMGLESLAEVLNAQELYPGLFTEVGVNYIGARRGLMTYDDIAEAVARANRGESFFSESVARKVAYIAEFNFTSTANQMPTTSKLFIRPRDASADHLVNVADAAAAYATAGAEVVELDGITHASPALYHEQYNAAILRWCQRMYGVGGGGGALRMR